MLLDVLTPQLVLQQAHDLRLDRSDAQQILCHATGQSRAWLVANDDRPLSPAQSDQCLRGFQRLAEGEPLAYVIGEQDFHGLTLTITPAVLVPRPDTETLVTWALEVLAQRPLRYPAKVLDLGTGSGAIALAVKHAAPEAQVCAVDASPAALAVAQANSQQLGLSVDFQLSDWWCSLAGHHFDLALSNPPYIAQGDKHLPALRHEPTMALTSGHDGLNALRQIIQAAPQQLQPGAWLLLEHGHTQGTAVRQLLQERGFDAVVSRLDLAGRERCSGGRWPEVSKSASP